MSGVAWQQLQFPRLVFNPVLSSLTRNNHTWQQGKKAGQFFHAQTFHEKTINFKDNHQVSGILAHSKP